MAKDGIVVRAKLTPRSTREGVEGLEATADGPALKIRVRAVPEDGAANAAVARVLADWLGVPKRNVTVVTGGKSRVKSLAVTGDPMQLVPSLAERVGALRVKKD